VTSTLFFSSFFSSCSQISHRLVATSFFLLFSSSAFSEDVLSLRNLNVVLRVQNTKHDGDRGWASALNFFGLIGIGGHFPRVRGIHRGTVIIEYLGNTVLLVAEYSPFASRIKLDGRGCLGVSSTTSARQGSEKFVAGVQGESCDEVCEKSGAKCDDRLVGMLMNCGDQGVCGATKSEWSELLRCRPGSFETKLTGDLKRAAPGITASGKCVQTIGRHLSCQGKHPTMKRACVCST
jgi:hypothetical protein